ncbi:PEP-CTERM sorting domain-containing protein [Paludisphaera soli]|uniref:PEP-CTERM sorting domain-containing protein n=1 Tax=Paludisphaera soli TaxID=2712865 RepID=UPI0013ED5358|nr:PEP-CTERM sorting domain-containing protein [Paludisphaera soli]
MMRFRNSARSGFVLPLAIVLLQAMFSGRASASLYFSTDDRDAARAMGLQGTGSRIFGFTVNGEPFGVGSRLSSATYYSTVGGYAYFLITGHQVENYWQHESLTYTLSAGPNAYSDPGETRSFTRDAITVFDGYLNRASPVDLAVVRVAAFAGLSGTVQIGTAAVDDVLDVYGFGRTALTDPFASNPIDLGQDGYAYAYSAPVRGDYDGYVPSNPNAGPEHYFATRFDTDYRHQPRHGNGRSGDSGGAAYSGDTLVGLSTFSSTAQSIAPFGRTGYLKLTHPEVRSFLARVVPTAAVPEPSSLVLAAIAGLAGIHRIRRRGVGQA